MTLYQQPAIFHGIHFANQFETGKPFSFEPKQVSCYFLKLPMPQTFNPTSECTDCGLCSRAQETLSKNATTDFDYIVREVLRRVEQENSATCTVPVGVSARHCHVNREAIDILFGSGAKLTPHRELYQPNAFASEEVISIVGPRLRAIERVRILGPMREYNQVEIARTDAIYLGLDPPIRDSGDLRNASPITFIGPKGAVTLPAAIRAVRHIHLRPTDVETFGLKGRSAVRAHIKGEKGLIFENVRLKVDDSYLPEIHLDTDDANAADLSCGITAFIGCEQ